MNPRLYNAFIDPEERNRASLTAERMKTQDKDKAKAYHSATDAFEERRLKRELKKDQEFDIGECHA